MPSRQGSKRERWIVGLGVGWGVAISVLAVLAAVASVLPDAASDLLHTRVSPNQQTVYLLLVALAGPFAATVRELDFAGIRGRRTTSEQATADLAEAISETMRAGLESRGSGESVEADSTEDSVGAAVQSDENGK